MLRLLINTLCRLVTALRRPADPTESVLPLLPGIHAAIDLDGLARGIDNVHIDVRLSPAFVAHARDLVAGLVDQLAGRGRWGGKSSGPTTADWEEFRGAYARMVEASIHRAKVTGQGALVQLAQVAALKFLLRQVQAELDALRQAFRSSVSSGGSTTEASRLQVNERLSWLARNRARVRYKVTRQVLEQVFKVESGALAELRQSLLGERWPVPPEMLFDPLLQADQPPDDEIMMRQYVLLAQEVEDPYGFHAIERMLTDLFRRSKPVSRSEIELARSEAAHRRLSAMRDRLKRQLERHRARRPDSARAARVGELETQVEEAAARLEQARTEYLRECAFWIENPANVDILFDMGRSREQLRAAKKEKDAAAAARFRAHRQVQARLCAVIERRCRASGLLPQIVASYEAVPLHKDHAGAFTAQQLRQFLSGGVHRKRMVQGLKDRQRTPGKEPPTAQLMRAAHRVAHLSCRRQRQYVVQFLKDFLTLRLDLKLARLAQQAMDRIELREDRGQVRLSGTNRTLYEFLASKEEAASGQTILSHVVLKADVRGSTTMVAELRKRGLNPASYFSLNFFAPINELLDVYGAAKVFIEGDAIILSLFEYEEVPLHRLSAARACGLAKRLLNVVHVQNAASKKSGLPELELGIGLVYSDEPPTFLYDDESQIMISSAIGKADRLSSCSWLLRKHWSQRPDALTNVEIYEIPDGHPLRGEKGEVHLRYNLNGIELDAAGFAKLESETALQRLELVLPGDDRQTVFYAGRYPDLAGAMHDVVIREGRIRLFDEQAPNFGHPTPRTFYEVITNPTLLAQVQTVRQAG